MCSALSILPIVDFNLGETSADMADLVDFLHGDGSTEWGMKRIATGHRDPYNLTVFEFGNGRCRDFLDLCSLCLSLLSLSWHVAQKQVSLFRTRHRRSRERLRADRHSYGDPPHKSAIDERPEFQLRDRSL